MHEALFSYFSGEMRAVSNALRRYLSFKSAACEPQSSQTLNISSPLFAPFDLPVRHRGTEKLRFFFFCMKLQLEGLCHGWRCALQSTHYAPQALNSRFKKGGVILNIGLLVLLADRFQI